MTDLARTPPALPQAVRVVNVGLPLFADAVAAQGADVVSVDWRVPAGGQPEAVAALGRLYGRHAEQVEAANAEVVRRLDTGVPLLTGVATAVDGDTLMLNGKEVRLSGVDAPEGDQACLKDGKPYVVAADGVRYYEGAVLESGWTIQSIDADRILLSRDGQTMALAYQ